jgi:hypothetical protein
MKKENKKIFEQIPEEIMEGMQCPKDFKCTRFTLEELCKAADIGKENCLECLERVPCDCPFVIDFGYARLCRCPLRVYIAKNLEK